MADEMDIEFEFCASKHTSYIYKKIFWRFNFSVMVIAWHS